jgi:hypothetical protein
MKLTSILFLLAAIAMTSIPLVTASDYMTCHKVDSQIPYAIHKLCFHPRLKVPGGRTKKGAKYGNVRVKIEGNCSKDDRHHVGSQMCLNRFFSLCAQEGPNFMKTGQARMDQGCEHYIMERTKGKHYRHKGDLLPKGTKKHPRGEEEGDGE